MDRNRARTRLRLGAASLLTVTALAAVIAGPASMAQANDSLFDNPSTTTATGVFTFTTASGVLPAWDSAGITLTPVSPATSSTSLLAATTKISLPVVAKTGTANATAGGFRLTNTKTKESVRCFLPTIDTRARVIDCILDAGYNAALFTINGIEGREFFGNSSYRTSVFTGMSISITSPQFAEILNDALSTTVFSASVTVANADLTVTRRLP